jgi:DNA-binding NarL/FixJ family response regulator
VVLTSSRVEWDIQNSYVLGANSYLTKPGEFSALVEALRSLLHLHQLPCAPEVSYAP